MSGKLTTIEKRVCPFCGAPERPVQQPVCCVESLRAYDQVTWGHNYPAGRAALATRGTP